MTDGHALLRAIEANADDDTPRLVYADWLDENAATESDCARAEFIRVQCELARLPESQRPADLVEREQRLLSDHGPAWAKAWPERLHYPTYRRGFLDPVYVGHMFTRNAARLAELMPLHHLRLFKARIGMDRLAAYPQLALVRRLTLASNVLRNEHVTALAVSPHLGNLQHLDLTDNHVGVRGLTDLAAARPPALRVLALRNNPIRDRGLLALAEADWPALTHLDVTQCRLGESGVIGLAESALARRLVSLLLMDNRDVPTAAWLALVSAPLQRLQRLDLIYVTVTDEVVERLAANPALVGLRTLNLISGTITDRAARAILDSPHLRNLRRLRLPEPTLYTDTLQRLRAAYGTGFNPPWQAEAE